ncbi:CoA ester lyase [Saccharothrix sp.]|uniref:HpcH/HpaI aldolase/citrate lyase family protein n=1 Tax=Saccharothrix sp. TaxID=1873460 RepID=UPI00281265BB|nr:CoA ester lyase [Saccharothrix sp.]
MNTAACATPRPGRVWIITPAIRHERFAAALTSTADVAMADLEDSVAPADKPAARDSVPRFLGQQPTAGPVRGVRINATTTRDGLADLLALAACPRRADVVLIPKVEAARDIEIAAAALDTATHTPHLWALIETPRALANLASIVAAPRLGGVVFGSADYAATVGCGLDWDALLHARATVVTAAAAAGLPAVDAPAFDLHDLDGLRREAQAAKKLGFYGKGAVHPGHVEILRRVFTPTDAQIAHARAVLAAEAASGGGITSVDGHMVGPPFFAAAHALLAEVDRR